MLKFPGSSQPTYDYRASYSQSDQIFKQRSKTVLVSFNKRFKCVHNSHFSTTDYCSVKLALAAKLIQYYLSEIRSHISNGSSRADLQSLQIGLVKRSSDHGRYYNPQANTCRERRFSPNKHLLQEKRGSSRLQITRHSAGLPASSRPTVPRSIALPKNRSSLTSDHLEPPSTACPYTGTASSNRPSCKEPAIYRYMYGVEYAPVYHSPSKNTAASSSRSITYNLTTKQQAPRSQKRAGAETT